MDGEPRWWRHTTGATAPGGTFDHWLIHAEADAGDRGLVRRLGARHLRGFTGMANFETIGGRIIEAHLRFADQWPDLYGPGWVEAVVRLHVTGAGTIPTPTAPTATASCCSGRTARATGIRPPALVEEVRAMPGVSSVQITFHEDKAPAHHAMPPGGFRLAIVNALTLDAGREGRKILRREISRTV